MSLQTQAILPGHLTVAEIAIRIEQASAFKVLGYRTMRVAEHVLFELENADGTVLCVEVFLNSWAAEDYAAVFSGESTLLTLEYSHFAAVLMQTLANSGGFWRKTDESVEGWLKLSAT